MAETFTAATKIGGSIRATIRGKEPTVEFAELVMKRRTVRRFEDTPVEREVLEKIARLGQHVPSAGFSQGQRLVIVTDPQQRRRVAEEDQEQGWPRCGLVAGLNGAEVCRRAPWLASLWVIAPDDWRCAASDGDTSTGVRPPRFVPEGRHSEIGAELVARRRGLGKAGQGRRATRRACELV